MMQTFRKNTRLILFIALAAFALLIFFQWGADVTGLRSQPETNIAVIDGSPVSYVNYLRLVQDRETNKRGITRDEIWAEMVDEIMWGKIMQKERVDITDEEVWAIIKNNPPKQIVESEYFRDEKGEFDFNKYLNVLRQPESQSWLREYEINIRRELPKEKIRSLVSTLGWVSPQEESMMVVKQSTDYSFTFISVPLYKLRGETGTDTGDIRSYFEKNIKDFTNPELKIVKYVFFERNPSAADTAETKEQMEDFLLRMKEDEDFVTVAQEVSDDTIIKMTFTKDSEIPAHLAVAYKKMKNGQLSNPILGPEGYEVIKRVKTGLIYRVKANIVISPSTIGDIQDKIEAFKEAVKESGFEATAKEYNLPVRKSYPLNAEKISFPVRSPDALAAFLKKNTKNEIAGPLNSPSGYYLFMVDSVIPEKTLNFDENFPVVRARYQRERLKTDLARFMNDIYQKLTADKTMEMLAFEDTSIILQKDSKNLFMAQSQYGYEFAGALAALEPKQTSPPLLTDWSGYIVRCDMKKSLPVDSASAGYVQVLRQMRLQYISQYIFVPKKITDNRDKFFE